MESLCKGCSVSFVDCVSHADDEVLQFYVNHGVVNRTRICGNPICKNTLLLKNLSVFLFRCGKYNINKVTQQKVKCRFVASGKKGTFFEKAKLSLAKIFYIVGTVLCIPGPKHKFIKANFGVRSQTIVDWYSFCCEVFVDHISNNNIKLGGVGHIVEINEARFGKWKSNRGCKFEQQWVFGGIDQQTRETFLIPVKKCDADMLLVIIKERIEPGTIIVSDCWKTYNCLQEENFISETINHSKTFVFPINEEESDNIKRGNSITHLSEYLFKAKYPDINERIHNFWLAVAKLYPPQQ